jgi:hypothetical protein
LYSRVHNTRSSVFGLKEFLQKLISRRCSRSKIKTQDKNQKDQTREDVIVLYPVFKVAYPFKNCTNCFLARKT